MAKLTPADDQNLDGYGAPIIPWQKVHERLAETYKEQGSGKGGQGTHWLVTTDPDGMPHAVPVGAVWVEDAFYFTAGAGTRKAKNLARDARCNITLSAKDLDLTVEGTAATVKDDATLKRLADSYRSQGWPVTVEDGAFTAEFSAPSAGPAPWQLYRVTPTTIFAFGTDEPFGATRWRF